MRPTLRETPNKLIKTKMLLTDKDKSVTYFLIHLHFKRRKDLRQSNESNSGTLTRTPSDSYESKVEAPLSILKQVWDNIKWGS